MTDLNVQNIIRPCCIAACALLGACAPTVRLSTPEPVKIDVNMRADIYTHNETEKKNANPANPDSLSPEQRRFNRRGQVQALKNDRIVGEANTGLLVIRNKPVEASYAQYAERIVREENEDRQKVFKSEAEELKKPLAAFIKDFAKETRDASFPGEWIQDENGEWKQR